MDISSAEQEHFFLSFWAVHNFGVFSGVILKKLKMATDM